MSKVNLAAGSWNIETDVWSPYVGLTNQVPFTVPVLGRTNLFIWAADWTGVTHGGNLTPDWWFWEHFRTLDLADNDLDSEGNTLLHDYQNGIDPAFIHFSLQFTNNYLKSSPANGTILVSGVAPDYEAVLINDTNLADAIWQPYSSSNVTLNLSSGNGTYDVLVGLKRVVAGTTPAWVETQLILDTVAPVLAATNPTTGAVSAPMIQLEGYVNESLSSLTYDVSNALGVVTNQQGYWNVFSFNTNSFLPTTNLFQCYDVALTNGVNKITLRASDLAGNVTTTNFSYTYTPPTTPPALTPVWPQNGAVVSGSNFTLQAQVSDPTATVNATIGSNTVQGVVERDGKVWIDNLPLDGGTNTVRLTATNVAGLGMATNINVVKSAVNVSLDFSSDDWMYQTSVNVTGAVSASGYDVWVNGVEATLFGDGTWEADNVPVNDIGSADFDVEVYPVGQTSNPVATQKISQLQPPVVEMASYQGHYANHNIFKNLLQAILNDPNPPLATDDLLDNTEWSYLNGGMDAGYNNFTGGYEPSGDGSSDPQYETWNDTLNRGENGFYSNFNKWWENTSIGTSAEVPSSFYTTADQTQTHVVIQPSAEAAIGATTAYLVQAQAWSFTDPIYRGETSDTNHVKPVAPNTMRIQGQSLVPFTNSDGSVSGLALIVARAAAQVDVTPYAPAQGYTFSVQTLKTKEDWQREVQKEIVANSGMDIENYLASNPFLHNRPYIKGVYAFYQKVYLEEPTEYYWCGLAKLAGAPVYAGLSDAQNATPILTGFQQTIMQMNIDILNDLAWQWEAYRQGGLQALEVIYAVDVNQTNLDLAAITAWRQIDQGIKLSQENDPNGPIMILNGNEALLSREQQQVLPPDYAKLNSFDTDLMSIFAQCPVWNSASVPYPGRDFSSIMGSGHNVANTTDRWNWITHPTTGIWDTWVNLSLSDKTSQVSVDLRTRAGTYSTSSLLTLY